MSKQQVLILPHTVDATGGGSCVGAWTIEALAEQYDVTVLTWRPTNVARVDRLFGTSLAQRSIRWLSIPVPITTPLRWTRLRLFSLTSNIIFRAARHLCKLHAYHVVIATMDEVDLGFRVIQYVHYPWAKFPRPNAQYGRYHFSLPVRLYRRLSASLSGFDAARIPANMTLVNSDWTGRVYRASYGVLPITLYPPVPGGFPDIPFPDRRRGFVCIGRFWPEKDIGKLIAILQRVRERGHDITFTVIGPMGNRAYMEELATLSAPYRNWITFLHDLPRSEMVQLVAQHRYAIHGMKSEHFGIAPAELQRAGCLTFVPDDGGPVEIVGHDERVIYHSIDDAVAKIDRVLSDPAFEIALQRDVEHRKNDFDEQKFVAGIRSAVEEFVGHRTPQ